MTKNITEMAAGGSNRAGQIFTATRLYSFCTPESPGNRGQVNLTQSDYHSNPMGFSMTFCILGLTDCGRQQEQTDSRQHNLLTVGCDIFSIIPQGVRV